MIFGLWQGRRSLRPSGRRMDLFRLVPKRRLSEWYEFLLTNGVADASLTSSRAADSSVPLRESCDSSVSSAPLRPSFSLPLLTEPSSSSRRARTERCSSILRLIVSWCGFRTRMIPRNNSSLFSVLCAVLGDPHQRLNSCIVALSTWGAKSGKGKLWAILIQF